MSRRAAIAIGVIVAWLAGLGLLIHQEYFRPRLEELAEAALRVTPGAVYYAVMDGDRQVGFASSTLDTTATGIGLRDYFLTAASPGDTAGRHQSVTTIRLSRALRLERFQTTSITPGREATRLGVVDGDTAMALTDSVANAPATHSRVSLPSPMLLPDLIPLAAALADKPHVGKHYTLPVFDPAAAVPRIVTVAIRAESSFVVLDTAIFDRTSARWRGAMPDTLKGWQVATDGPGGFTGWVDDQGRILTTSQAGLVLKRLPFEVAFENWRLNTTPSSTGTPTQGRPPI